MDGGQRRSEAVAGPRTAPAGGGDPLAQPVTRLRGVGPARLRALERLGIRTLEDLLLHLPRGYEEPGAELPVAFAVRAGGVVRVRGTVVAAEEREVRPNLWLVQASVGDATGQLEAVWFNQRHVLRRLRPGAAVVLRGQVEWRYGRPQLTNPELLDAAAGPGHGLLPVYPLSEGLTQAAVRGLVEQALRWAEAAPDPLPAALRQRLGLPDRATALRWLHLPPDREHAERGRRRLAFEELFYLQLAVAILRRSRLAEQAGYAHPLPPDMLDRFAAALPFALTGAQRRVIGEVLADMAAPRPMNRLVQGDVGSGKTVVAAAAIYAAVACGCQAALMAPTEILAQQHAQRLGTILGALGVPLALLTGSTPRAERERVLAGLADGTLPVAVGTHALLEEEVRFARLTLVVTDEQHRFGVRQRLRLVAKGGLPDVLVMTATPIPRTLALTLYGDLDVSVLDELPPGRRPVRTLWFPTARRARAYGMLVEQLRAGRQAYVVCPAIAAEPERDLKSATDLYRRLRRHLGDRWRVGLLHGRLAPELKRRVMEAFRDGHLHVLVTTSVVEVGVDVPNATLMLIEDADRFGLAQLHQLRGRVGRGAHPGICVMVADPKTPEARERLQVMVETADGFRIAEKDLELRGPGEFLGTRQHGLPEFRVANLIRDLPLLELAQGEARALVEADPELRAPEHAPLRRQVLQRYGQQLALLLAG